MSTQATNRHGAQGRPSTCYALARGAFVCWTAGGRCRCSRDILLLVTYFRRNLPPRLPTPVNFPSHTPCYLPTYRPPVKVLTRGGRSHNVLDPATNAKPFGEGNAPCVFGDTNKNSHSVCNTGHAAPLLIYCIQHHPARAHRGDTDDRGTYSDSGHC